MIRWIRAFGAFCYDFVVGDDWRVAVAILVAIVATWLLSLNHLPAWWVLPVAVVAVVPWSLWRARRRDNQS
ncbi:hypothetical protein [Fodinicola acaciae]|uniref:hypothetical protein n=1 Tax=Fodinicola acaciae TaxID=2681555 RepID=UPI0013D3DB21|nr:hypothetical protein [Fodinicola acaciae]